MPQVKLNQVIGDYKYGLNTHLNFSLFSEQKNNSYFVLVDAVSNLLAFAFVNTRWRRCAETKKKNRHWRTTRLLICELFTSSENMIKFLFGRQRHRFQNSIVE